MSVIAYVRYGVPIDVLLGNDDSHVLDFTATAQAGRMRKHMLGNNPQ